MIRQISASAVICALFAISTTAYAQGRPAGAGSQGGGSRPSMSQQQDRSASMRAEAELRREQAQARRQAQEEARLAAESAHAEAGPPDPLPSGRQDPNAHAADEAFLAEANADNAEDHGLTRRVTGDANRTTPDVDDADEADTD